jgi:hypothetical protein
MIQFGISYEFLNQRNKLEASVHRHRTHPLNYGLCVPSWGVLCRLPNDMHSKAALTASHMKLWKER